MCTEVADKEMPRLVRLALFWNRHTKSDGFMQMTLSRHQAIAIGLAYYPAYLWYKYVWYHGRHRH